ncbi:MAG: hypothetical protein Q4B85_06685 [Lachnospiraceae bacterium]|nr:hypothetical protein [Lachnospiraceae bacterium]
MAGTELAKAYVPIVPSAKGIKGSIKSILSGEASSAGTAAGTSIAGSIAGAITKGLAAAGIGASIKASLDAGGAIQQSFGGLDTLYGSASEAAKNYSQEAYKAGISANSYAEQAVSFGAALKSAFDGDVKKAAESANTAILDMTDNAAKMGTPIENIQNAYQGFAKQNYTMLDNLKLGYGGTKAEMERLLADAEKLSGKKYNLDNLGDVYDAIHVIQEDLGLTGVAAAEAEGTFTGSFGAMKAAAENLLASLSASEMDVGPQMSALVSTAEHFFLGNFVPMIGRIAASLPDAASTMIKTAGPIIEREATGLVKKVTEKFGNGAWEKMLQSGSAFADKFITGISVKIPDFLTSGTELVNNTVTGILNSVPVITGTGISVASTFIKAVTDNVPNFLSAGSSVIKNFAEGIKNNVPVILEQGAGLVTDLIDGVGENIPLIIANGADLINFLSNGILEGIPELTGAAAEIIGSVSGVVLENVPELVTAGFSIVENIASGILENAPVILDQGAGLVMDLIDGIGENIPVLIGGGTEMLNGVVSGIVEEIPTITGTAVTIVGNLLVTLLENAPTLITAGCSLVTNLAVGLINQAPSILQQGAHLVIKLVNGIISNFPSIVSSAAAGVAKFCATVLQNLPSVLQSGISIIARLASGLIQAIPQIPGACMQAVRSVITAFKGYDWASIGLNIITGVASGITGAIGTIAEAARSAAQSALTAAKNFLGIKSPSRRFKAEVGAMIPPGLAEGVLENKSVFLNAITSVCDESRKVVNIDDYRKFRKAEGYASFYNPNSRIEQLLEIIAYKDNSVIIGNKEFRRTLYDLEVAFVS